MKYKVVGEEVPHIPWEEKPANCKGVVWRSLRNPIIPRNIIPSSMAVHNSSLVPFQGEFAGVFRCDSRSRRLNLHAGKSKDGIHWEIQDTPIPFIVKNRSL